MDLLEAIHHAEAELTHTLDELRMAKELVAALETDAKKIKLELVGLRSYAQRKGLSEDPDLLADNIVPISGDISLVAGDAIDLALLSRTEAVATVMAQIGGPIDRAAIHERFVDADRFDSIDEISLSLSGLKRAGRVERLGRGLWQLLETEPATGS